MTLGNFVPLAFLLIAFVEAPLFMGLTSRGVIKPGAMRILILASASLPVLAYVILNYALPEVGAIEAF